MQSCLAKAEGAAQQSLSEFGEPGAVRPRTFRRENPGPYGTRLTKSKQTNPDNDCCADPYSRTPLPSISSPAAAALPPVPSLGSDVVPLPNVFDVNPELPALVVEVGGVRTGTRPGCGWLGGTAGTNEAGLIECPADF